MAYNPGPPPEVEKQASRLELVCYLVIAAVIAAVASWLRCGG